MQRNGNFTKKTTFFPSPPQKKSNPTHKMEAFKLNKQNVMTTMSIKKTQKTYGLHYVKLSGKRKNCCSKISYKGSGEVLQNFKGLFCNDPLL